MFKNIDIKQLGNKLFYVNEDDKLNVWIIISDIADVLCFHFVNVDGRDKTEDIDFRKRKWNSTLYSHLRATWRKSSWRTNPNTIPRIAIADVGSRDFFREAYKRSPCSVHFVGCGSVGRDSEFCLNMHRVFVLRLRGDIYETILSRQTVLRSLFY